MTLSALALFAAAAAADAPPVAETAERVDAYLSSIVSQVEAGDLTEAEARGKLANLGRRLSAGLSRPAGGGEDRNAQDRTDQDRSGEGGSGETAEDRIRAAKLDAIRKTLAAAVEAGKIDAPTARRKMQAVRKAVEGDPDTTADDRIPVSSYDDAERTLLRLVAIGELQPGAAQERLRDLRGRLGMSDASAGKAERAEMLRKIKQAVADGVLTETEAKAKAEALLGG